MERKALKALELSDTQIDSVMKLFNKEIDPLKAELETTKSERNSYKQSVTDRDNQLNELKKTAGNSKELQDQIKQLQDDNKSATETFKAQLADVKKDSAIKLALKDSKAKDADMVFKALDLDSVKLTDDGKLKGLDEQINDFKKSHDYMFEAESVKGQEPKGSIKASVGGNPSGTNSGQETLTQKIASRLAGNE